MNNFSQVNPLNPGINYLRGNLPFAFFMNYADISTCIEQDLKEIVILGLITWSEIGKLYIQAKGPTIWLLRKDMGVFRKKEILQTDFEGKKILQGNTWRKKLLHGKKYLSRPIMLEKYLTTLYAKKKINHQRFGEKNSYQNQINHTPPPQKKANCRPLNKSVVWVVSNWKLLFARVRIVLFSITIFMF